MSVEPVNNIANWLQTEALAEAGCYRAKFAERHLGNIWIRSIHGGVSAALIELCCEMEARKQIAQTGEEPKALYVTSSNVDYLRITKDADIYARTSIVRVSRRLCVVDITCWQDEETVPVVRGTVTLKIER